MTMALPAVTQDVLLEQFDGVGSSLLHAELSYHASDPWAVTMVFHVHDRQVSWTFARELLVTGLGEPTGEGDIHVRPSLDEEGRAAVLIELCTPSGLAYVQISAIELYMFVDRMLAAVPPGTESEHTDLDSALAELLDVEA
ncbi:MAG TPA: SsgA family sporulation/cell division regulator [Nocardioidaceae bacterium]|nr:SsgA family sporulation/cell division regulator [Nocardioidaceae bacterium]